MRVARAEEEELGLVDLVPEGVAVDDPLPVALLRLVLLVVAVPLLLARLLLVPLTVAEVLPVMVGVVDGICWPTKVMLSNIMPLLPLFCDSRRSTTVDVVAVKDMDCQVEPKKDPCHQPTGMPAMWNSPTTTPSMSTRVVSGMLQG